MILRNLLLVAAVLCTLSAAAAGKVEVTGDTSHGTVQSSVQGAVVTLIVTPAQGYYIRKSDITASKSFMPVPEGRRMAKGIPVSDELTLVGNDPDDLSLSRTYTVTLPGEEYDVLLDVQYSQRRQITEQMLSLSETLFVYNEQVQRPTVFVDGLTEGVDYDVTYSDPASVTSGTYTLTVQGRSTWVGTFERSYKIFSGGKAEVKKDIKGGIIATAIDGLTLTLTVTPENGYYIRKEDVVVEKTFMPVESARRAAPVSNSLTINGDDPDDLSLPRTYTVELPGWEYDALVGAEFQSRQKLTEGMVTLSAASFIYNGKDQQPEITVRGLTEGKDYLVIFKETSWSDVGTYTVDIVGRSTWKETITKTFTITKAPSVVTLVPEPLSLTYNGDQQTLIAAGDATGGTLLYSLDNSSYNTTLPAATAAGSYTVYYMVQGDSNHKDAEPETVTVVIAKKDIVISGIQAQDKVFDRSAEATLVYDAVVFDGIVEGDALTVTAKGTFADANAGKDKQVAVSELKLAGTSIANYRLAPEGQQTTAKATITEKVVDKPVIEFSESSFIYDGSAKTLAEVVVKDGETVIPATEYTIGYEDNVNVGEAKVIIKDAEGGNYKVSGQAVFSIVKATVVISADPVPLQLTYTGAPQKLISAGDATGGTLLYSLDGENYQADLPKAVDAGSYTVYYKVQGDGNHTDSEVKSVTVSIEKKAITVSGITAMDKVYDMTTAVTLGFDAVIFGGMAEGDELTVTAKGFFVDANAGKDKEVTISELTLDGTSIANYRLAAEGQQTTAKATITEKVIDKPVIELSESSFVYDGNAKTPSVVVKDGETVIPATEYAVDYEDNVNVGAAKVIIKDVEGGNYTVSGQATFSIEKAGSDIAAAPVALELFYTGEPQTLITAGDAIGGTLLYSVDGENYLADLPTGITAGSYTVYYKVEGDGNHADSEVKTVTVVIDKKEVAVSGIAAVDKVYDGTTAATLNYDAVVFEGLVQGDVLTVTAKGIFVDANAGKDKQVTISELKLDGQSIGNYQLAAEGQQTIATATISKAACVVAKAPVPSELTYTGAPQALAEAGDATDGVMQYSLDKAGSFSPAIPTGIDAGTYTLYYYVAGDQNHEDTDVESISITIKEKVIDKPVIELAEETFVYDGTAKTPAVVVKDGETVIPASEYTVGYKANVNAGEAQVIITDAKDGNYTVSGYAGFIIKKAQLMAIADNKLMELGTPMPELTVRHKGFVNDETEDVVSKPSVAICEEIADAVAGIYTIKVLVGEAANYDIVGESGTLTVFVPQVLADEAGNEVEASVTIQEDTCHVVITELTEGMLSGKEDIPASLKDGEGETYQVTEVASEAFDEKPSNVIIALPEGVSTTNPVTNVINGDGTCETLDLTEVSGFETDKPLEVENVVYERAVEQGEAMTVCLPYDCDVPQDATVYVLDATTDGNVSFTPLEGNTMQAYQPYLMQLNQGAPTQQPNKVRRANEVEGGKLRLGAKNVSIAPTQEDAATSVGDFKLCGTVKGLTHAEGYNMKAYVMQPDLTWRMTASAEPEDADKQYLAPFQAYMLLVGGDGSEVIGTDIEDVVPTIRVTIGEAGYATAYLTVPVTAPEDITVYTGKITGTGCYKYLMLTELDGTIPAQTAVILKGNAGTYAFNVAEEADPVEDNDLKGSFEAVDATGKYVLAKVGDKVGFYKAGSGMIAAGKAYLESDANVKAFYFTEEDETSLNEEFRVKNEESAAAVYDLSGRLVNSLKKGVIIVGGKKILK